MEHDDLLQSDANFACPAVEVNRWTSEHVPTYAYEFRDDAAPERFDISASQLEWLELVEKVCYDEGVPIPDVVFREKPDADFTAFTDNTYRIRLPEPAWALENDPDCFSENRWQLVVFHELGHLIAYVRHGQDGHTPFMYAKTFQLCQRHGLDLTFAYENEIEYKPRAAKRGWNLFKRWALEAA